MFTKVPKVLKKWVTRYFLRKLQKILWEGFPDVFLWWTYLQDREWTNRSQVGPRARVAGDSTYGRLQEWRQILQVQISWSRCFKHWWPWKRRHCSICVKCEPSYYHRWSGSTGDTVGGQAGNEHLWACIRHIGHESVLPLMPVWS
jgi:hypothetical protein